MNLYDLIHQISEILTPNTNSFFEYVINTSDDNGGFLRTCFINKNDKLKNFEIQCMDKVLVCFAREFVEDDYYNYGMAFTKTKLQLFYWKNVSIPARSRWSCGLGYKYSYVFDLKARTYTYKRNEVKRYLDIQNKGTFKKLSFLE